MPALALLFELADRVDANNSCVVDLNRSGFTDKHEVSIEHTKQAFSWCDYLECHAKRIYSCIVMPQIRAANVLAEKIKTRKLGQKDFFPLREVYLKNWSGLDSPELAQEGASILHDAGWIRPIREESGPQGGRPSLRYEINPKVFMSQSNEMELKTFSPKIPINEPTKPTKPNSVGFVGSHNDALPKNASPRRGSDLLKTKNDDRPQWKRDLSDRLAIIRRNQKTEGNSDPEPGDSD